MQDAEGFDQRRPWDLNLDKLRSPSFGGQGGERPIGDPNSHKSPLSSTQIILMAQAVMTMDILNAFNKPTINPSFSMQKTEAVSPNLGLLSSTTSTASGVLGKMEQNRSTHPVTLGNDNISLQTANEDQGLVRTILAESSHPTALIFHLLFRTAALATYMFLWIVVGNSFILIFVLTVLLLAMDFWAVKNVTGRLLVGLRWWTEPKADGSTAWIFESKAANFRPNPVDSRIFWWSLYLYPVIWLCLGLIAVLRFQFSWLLVIGMALVLGGTNLIGYTKCDKDARKKLMSGLGNRFMGSFIGTKIEAILS